MREVSFSESHYPIHSPIPTSPDSEKKKCKLYKVLERVFSEEMIARASCERIPTSSGIINELLNAFQKLPITATESELSEVLVDTFLYLDSFCSGYRSVLVLFKEEVEHVKSYLNAKDVDLVLSIPMDLAKKQKLLGSTKRALQSVINHPSISSWFRNIVAMHPVKSTGQIKKQGLCEGVNAAAEELSKPAALYSIPAALYSMEDGLWYWDAQFFSVRSRNLELLRPFVVKTEAPSDNGDSDATAAMAILETLKFPVVVTGITVPARKKPSSCGFFEFFSCGKACD
jgi:hypothetical protein